MKKLIKITDLHIFALICGLFFLVNNSVSIVIPIQLLKFNISYVEIGGIISSFAIGMSVIKIFVGAHSDLVGRKRYLLFALLISALLKILLIFSVRSVHFIIILCLDGMCRGFVSSVRFPYIVELSDNKEIGTSFGIVNSITTICSAIGAASVGIFYKYNRVNLLFILFFTILMLSFIITLTFIPEFRSEKKEKKVFYVSKFLKLNKFIWIFCIILFLQNIVTAPLWDMIFPIYFVKVMGYSVAILGLIMSADELIGSPVSLLSGYLSDKINSKFILWISFLLAAIAVLLLTILKNEFVFIVVFLFTSVFVSVTYTCLEKVESEYVRENSKGFDVGLISFSASIGNAFGSIILGNLANNHSIVSGFISFSFIYIIIAIILLISFRKTAFLNIKNINKEVVIDNID